MKFFLLVLLLSCLHGPDRSAAADSRPNIVYFLVDDLGRADVGFAGSDEIKTPNIDRLAGEGAVLDAFYVQPVCSPTRAALLTGRYATRTGVYSVVRPGAPWGLPLTEHLLPEALRSAGYTTAICGKWHLGEFQPAYTPTHRGFDRQYGHFFGAIDYFTKLRDGKRDWYRDDQPCADEGYSTSLIAREACAIIRDQPKEKPLFLYVPFNGVHSPLQVPETYLKPYQNLKGNRRTYAGMVAAVDEAIGQITAALGEKGLRQDTLILFSSDNGGPAPGRITRNTPLRAGKGTLYEGGIRVCAFATWPGRIPPGITIREPLHAVDWYPTLRKLAAVPSDETAVLDGQDILPVLTQGAKSPHDALLLMGTRPGRAALRMGDWKLLLNPDGPADGDASGSAPDPATEPVWELYNLADDIGETRNLAATLPEKVRELRPRLEAFLKNAVPPGGGSAAGQGRRRAGRPD